MKEFYVYGLLDENNNYFYIGKGQKKRLKTTISCQYNNKLKRNKIKKVKELTGVDPKIKIFCKGSEDYCFDIEKKLIKLYGKQIDGTGTLCNIADGGEGCAGYKLTEERKKQISDFFKKNNPMQNPKYREKVRLSKLGNKNPMFGKSLSVETKTKLSNSIKGNKHYNFGKHRSEETKNKISLKLKGIIPWIKGKSHTEETLDKIRTTRCQTTYRIYSPNNDIIETNFLNKFCTDNNLNKGHMYQIVKGNLKSYKGWKVEKL